MHMQSTCRAHAMHLVRKPQPQKERGIRERSKEGREIQSGRPPKKQMKIIRSRARAEYAWLLRSENKTFTEIGARIGVSRLRAMEIVERFAKRISKLGATK
jgi:hypothetical protein